MEVDEDLKHKSGNLFDLIMIWDTYNEMKGMSIYKYYRYLFIFDISSHPHNMLFTTDLAVHRYV